MVSSALLAERLAAEAFDARETAWLVYSAGRGPGGAAEADLLVATTTPRTPTEGRGADLDALGADVVNVYSVAPGAPAGGGKVHVAALPLVS
jgi:hypothetical protein